MEEQCYRVCIVEKLAQLFAGVSEVDVDRHTAHLGRHVLRLEVFVAVIEVQPDLRGRAEARCREHCSHARGAVVELCPGESPIAVHDRAVVGQLVGERLPDCGEVVFQVGCLAQILAVHMAKWVADQFQPLAVGPTKVERRAIDVCVLDPSRIEARLGCFPLRSRH